MKINFFKMQATGNDYIYCDLSYNDGDFILKNAPAISKDLSKRRFSVGSDGLVLITKDKKADSKAIIYNSDGSRAEICGNALRCIGYYLSEKLNKNLVYINTDSGVRSVYIKGDLVSVNMEKPCIDEKNQKDLFKRIPIRYQSYFKFCRFIDLGNPHLVLYLKDDKTIDNGLIEALLQKNSDVNVEIVKNIAELFSVTVYERGSGETLCCGSGAVAVYFALRYENFLTNDEIVLRFKGGDLLVKSSKNDLNADIYIIGQVKFCYKGVIENYALLER